MRTYMKNKIVIIVTVFLLSIAAAGCCNPAAETENSFEPVDDEIINSEIPLKEKASDFTLTYNGKETNIMISLKDCDCVYDKNGIQVYSKYIGNHDWVDEDFPYFQYVFYIQTPYEDRQIFPVKDYLVNMDTETIYVSSEISGSINMYEINLFDITNHKTDYEYKIMNKLSLAELIGEAHQLPERIFTDLHFSFTGIEKENEVYIVKGEASGIHKPTGEKYYIDWEWDDVSKKETAAPYLLTVYDEEKDREVLEECEKAFERLKQGDWSMVEIDSDMEYLRGLTGEEWCSKDVNEDGLPELIGCFVPEDSNIKQIAVIFSYQAGKLKMVMADVNDGMEYYFLCDNGNLIYDYEITSGYGSFTQCVFDAKWERKDLHRLILYRFQDSYPEKEDKYLKELYPDTYGAGGGGFYFYSVEPKTEEELKNNQENEYWTWKLISKEQFLESYEEMTGYDFLEENIYWPDFF